MRSLLSQEKISPDKPRTALTKQSRFGVMLEDQAAMQSSQDVSTNVEYQLDIASRSQVVDLVATANTPWM